ncbi:MAG: 5-bromo-4-chloroindolyl phosphate hydrolysis family protein [Fibrobacteria bacterium]|nr:5-bromo-4-chloroindolyl phosphate hydrolysis family protein [Fibrobacteria bacterium]
MGRQLVPGVAAGFVFAGLYLGLSMPLLAAAGVGLAAWVGTLLLLPRPRPLRVVLETAPADSSRLSGVLAEAEAHIERLDEHSRKVAKTPAGHRSQRIVRISRGILSDLRKDPSEYSKARPFLENYLPSARRVMDQYVDLSQRGVSSPDIESALKKADAMLETLGQAFESQRANLAQLDVVNLEVELKLLESTLKMENLGT